MQNDHIIRNWAIYKIGCSQFFKAISAGAIIAYIFIALFAGAFWAFNSLIGLFFFFGCLGMYVSAVFLGSLLGWLVYVKRKIALPLSILFCFLMVAIGSISASLTSALFQWDIRTFQDPNFFYDYITSIVFFATAIGLLPIIGIGIWLSWSLKKRLALHQANSTTSPIPKT